MDSEHMEVEENSKLSVLPFRRRGLYSKNFRPISVVTNHFYVKMPSHLEKIYIFQIRMLPDVLPENITLREQIFLKIETSLRKAINNPVLSGGNVFTTTEPTDKNYEFETDTHKVILKQVKIINVKENPLFLLSFLNNGLRNMMRKLNYAEIGKSGKYFNIEDKNVIDGLSIFNGYKSNFNLLEKGFYLRIDSVKKIVRNQTVLQAIDELYRLNQDKDKEEKRMILKENLTGKIIMSNYGKTAYYKISDVVFDEFESIIISKKVFEKNNLSLTLDTTANTDESSMIKEEPCEKTKDFNLQEYYENVYGIKIKNLKQPILKAESKRKNEEEIFLIPELCLMTGIPENFDEFRRKKISEQTIKNPNEKKSDIEKLMKELKNTSHFSSLKQIGLEISPTMERFEAKQIPIPRLALGEDNRVEEGKESFFNLYNRPIYSNKHSVKCGLIYFNGLDTRMIIDTFESTSRNLKVKVEVKKLNAGDIDLRKPTSQILAFVKKANEEGCNICLIIIPNNIKTQYKKIKHDALISFKMLTQIMTEGTMRRKNLQSIATKVLLQIIAKRGNTLWVPKMQLSIEDIMLVGIEQAKNAHNAYELSLCATINSTYTTHFTHSKRFKESSERFGATIKLMLGAVTAYIQRNKIPPKEIILFQESCSNDQMRLYMENMINPLRKDLNEIYKDNVINLTLIMISMRSSERFFTPDNVARNVPAGTVVSETVVSNNYDFYLISQGTNRGSTVPNHYKVIYTDSKLEEGQIQELIFSQCFNYVNWTGSIKMPAILQYAKKCAKFHTEIFETDELCADLANKLYFI